MDLQVAIGLAATVGPAVVGGFVRYVRAETRGDVQRLDGRVDRHEAVCQAIRNAELDWRTELSARLARMEAKIDKALGID